MVAINPDSKLVPTWYQSQLDEGLAWQLKPLSGFEFMQVQSGARQTEEGIVYSGAAIKDGIRFAVQGWSGVTNQDGQPLGYAFPLLDMLPMQLLNEVFQQIMDRAFIREYERKNSSSQSQSTVTQSNSTATPVSGGDTATEAAQPPSNSG